MKRYGTKKKVWNSFTRRFYVDRPIGLYVPDRQVVALRASSVYPGTLYFGANGRMGSKVSWVMPGDLNAMRPQHIHQNAVVGTSTVEDWAYYANEYQQYTVISCQLRLQIQRCWNTGGTTTTLPGYVIVYQGLPDMMPITLTAQPDPKNDTGLDVAIQSFRSKFLVMNPNQQTGELVCDFNLRQDLGVDDPWDDSNATGAEEYTGFTTSSGYCACPYAFRIIVGNRGVLAPYPSSYDPFNMRMTMTYNVEFRNPKRIDPMNPIGEDVDGDEDPDPET